MAVCLRNRQPASDWRQVGRNDSCPCGSGKKFKWCCGARRLLPHVVRSRRD
ncbi:MAG: hypothetical protein DRR15_00595 [Gammaproteobacteria bacterium]|nr:MAG: hypothetical protein DRR15_00595 [Gammaproteobacteria bacterium]